MRAKSHIMRLFLYFLRQIFFDANDFFTSTDNLMVERYSYRHFTWCFLL
ncbi:hypothetical protein VDIAB_110387 [Vibrio diabolicus]|nr:hypothetical protein VDIAB_110387 [Vibrio diabolicus]